ncbi:MAG: glycosyltransferase family 4 protein [Lachnospiraceae bacterium]|nr:glycosyltransferase family 4 protein [Lachnospiraceae bacterium]
MRRTYGIDNRYSRVVVHFLKVVNETTSGYREFAVWRTSNIEHEKNIVFVCGSRMDCGKKTFPEVEMVWGNKDIGQIRQKVKEICAICREKNIPVVFHIQQHGVIMDIIKACAGLNIRKHMVYTIRNTYSEYTNKKKKCNYVLAALYAKHVTFLSYASYKDYPQIVKLWKHGNISIIEHGACQNEIIKINWAERRNMKKPVLELVYTARLVPVKNHRFFLDIMNALENVHITFIGGGEKYSDIQKEIRKRHLENKVTITGLVSREEVYKILGQGDVYVSPSRVEGLPVSVLEAMHAGLPIILSDIGPHIELAQKTDSIMTLPLEKQLWIDKLNYFKQLQTEELAKMGEKNARVANRYFTLDRMHKRYSQLYRSLEL